MGLFGPSKRMLEDFGRASQTLIDAVNHDDDLKNMSGCVNAIMSALEATKEVYGIVPDVGSQIDKVARAIAAKDMNTALSDTQTMARALKDMRSLEQRGSLFYSWFKAQRR
jgi:hypothetical protein